MKNQLFQWALLGLTLFSWPQDSRSQPILIGSEFRVNTSTLQSQISPEIAATGNGTFHIVWVSGDFSNSDIYLQRYQNAQVQGPEFRVNSQTADLQFTSRLAINGSGEFVVVWSSLNQDQLDGIGVFGQRYNADGSRRGGEFLINTYTTESQQRPAVALASNGSFIVVWENEASQDGNGGGIFGRRFRADGVADGPEFQVNSTILFNQRAPDIALDANDNFTVVWQSENQDGSEDAVVGQRFNSNGTSRGGEFVVNTFTSDDQVYPSLAVSPSGQFVVAWESHDLDADNNLGIAARRFQSTGNAIGDEFRVNVVTTCPQSRPSVAMDSLDRFLIVWADGDDGCDRDGDDFAVFGRLYNADGNPDSAPYQINTYTLGSQLFPSVAVDAALNFIVTWSSFDQRGDIAEIYAQRLRHQPPATSTFTATPSFTPTHTPTATNTPTSTATATVTSTITSTRTPSSTFTVTATPTQTGTPSHTSTTTRTATRTNTPLLSPTPSRTPTITRTPTRTLSPTRTAIRTSTPTPTGPSPTPNDQQVVRLELSVNRTMFVLSTSQPQLNQGIATVRALNRLGNPVASYDQTVVFDSTDFGLARPAPYTFVPSDGGVRPFPQSPISPSRPGPIVLRAYQASDPSIRSLDLQLTASYDATDFSPARNIYFVHPDGVDDPNRPGTFLQPWRQISFALQRPQVRTDSTIYAGVRVQPNGLEMPSTYTGNFTVSKSVIIEGESILNSVVVPSRTDQPTIRFVAAGNGATLRKLSVFASVSTAPSKPVAAVEVYAARAFITNCFLRAPSAAVEINEGLKDGPTGSSPTLLLNNTLVSLSGSPVRIRKGTAIVRNNLLISPNCDVYHRIVEPQALPSLDTNLYADDRSLCSPVQLNEPTQLTTTPDFSDRPNSVLDLLSTANLQTGVLDQGQQTGTLSGPDVDGSPIDRGAMGGPKGERHYRFPEGLTVPAISWATASAAVAVAALLSRRRRR